MPYFFTTQEFCELVKASYPGNENVNPVSEWVGRPEAETPEFDLDAPRSIVVNGIINDLDKQKNSLGKKYEQVKNIYIQYCLGHLYAILHSLILEKHKIMVGRSKDIHNELNSQPLPGESETSPVSMISRFDGFSNWYHEKNPNEINISDTIFPGIVEEYMELEDGKTKSKYCCIADSIVEHFIPEHLLKPYKDAREAQEKEAANVDIDILNKNMESNIKQLFDKATELYRDAADKRRKFSKTNNQLLANEADNLETQANAVVNFANQLQNLKSIQQSPRDKGYNHRLYRGISGLERAKKAVEESRFGKDHKQFWKYIVVNVVSWLTGFMFIAGMVRLIAKGSPWFQGQTNSAAMLDNATKNSVSLSQLFHYQMTSSKELPEQKKEKDTPNRPKK